ncbi:MAG: dihydroneopterin aldolase [bacterium]
MDTIVLKGMRFYAYHGALPDEREQGQEFVIDVALETDLRRAGQTDELTDTVDYREAYEHTREVVEGPARRLLESVAESVAQRLLALERVAAVTVSVRKPRVRLPGPVDYSEVTIRREK